MSDKERGSFAIYPRLDESSCMDREETLTREIESTSYLYAALSTLSLFFFCGTEMDMVVLTKKLSLVFVMM
jgi:ribosomal protein L30E